MPTVCGAEPVLALWTCDRICLKLRWYEQLKSSSARGHGLQPFWDCDVDVAAVAIVQVVVVSLHAVEI
jgi:hypothetical protein